jgi:hypothetical protein
MLGCRLREIRPDPFLRISLWTCSKEEKYARGKCARLSRREEHAMFPSPVMLEWAAIIGGRGRRRCLVARSRRFWRPSDPDLCEARYRALEAFFETLWR